MLKVVVVLLRVLLVLTFLVSLAPFAAPLAAAAGEPVAPTDLAAAVGSATRVDLLWTDQSDNETGFRIERSLDDFVTAPSASFAAAADLRTFSDNTVLATNIYYYRVIAVNGSGDSAPSNTAIAVVTAGLQVGPIDPASVFGGNPNTGLPGYYQDDQGTRLALTPITGDGVNAPTQIFDPVVASNPYSAFLGFGTEAFYYLSVATFDTSAGRGLVEHGVEAAFGTGDAVPGQEMVFTRTRFRLDVPVPGTYTIQHPYGTHTFNITQGDIDASGGLFFTEDIGITPRDFLEAGTGPVTRFLRQAIPPAGWIGDGATVGPVTGSPTGFNRVRVTGPVGVNLNGAGSNIVETDQFSISGRLQTTVAPVASFTQALDPVTGVAPVAVTFTDTSTGAPTAWLWDFGDGSSSALRNPVHTYNAAGVYTASLRVTNAGGASTTSQTISVYTQPVASFTRTLPNGVPPVAISFADTSTGNPTSWSWDFGDGATSALRNPSHVYAEAGAYAVTMTATNPAGSDSTSQVVRISPALTANFAESVSGGLAPLTVSFTDDSAGAITGWSWDLGNGAGSTLQNPSTTYDTPGNYTVTLAVTDAAGAAGVSRTIRVYSAPSAGFTKTVNPLARKTVKFTDTSAGNPASWSWDFGDGTTSAVRNPTKAYAAVGTYTVTLAVTNPAGSSATSQTVFVSGLDPAAPLSLQVGPIDPISIYQGNPNTGLPGYYQDDQGTRLALTPITGDGVNAPTQIFDPVVASNPYSAFLGFGTEAFYYLSVATFDTSAGRGLVEHGVEAAFGTGDAVPGQEMVFTRTRFRLDVPVPGTYTIQHPYGTHTFNITQGDIDASGGLFFTEDIGITPRDFLEAGTGPVTRFLRQAIPPAGWIGDGATIGTVTGSPTGFNRVRVTGPAGVNLNGAGSNIVETDQFSISGRLQTTVAPVASFTQALDPVTGVAPVAVTFTDTSTGAPTAWLWDFGDGSSSALRNPVHTYNAAGNYTVTLTAMNAAGNSAASQTVSVYTLPVAGFTRAPALGLPPLLVNFTDTSTGNITAWSWDFNGDTIADSALQDPGKAYAAGGTYVVTLTVTNPAGSGSTSLPVQVGPVPAAPSGLATAIISATQVDLAWTDNAVNEDGYRVERSTDGVNFTTPATLAADAAAYSDLTAALGNTYSYRVVAFNALGDSVPSNVATVSVTTPAAPTALRAGGVAFTQADVVWADNSDNEASFRIERSEHNFATAPGATFTAAANATSFSDTTVVEGPTYSYRVVAVNVLGESVPSNVVTVLIGLPVPATSLAAALISSAQVDLAWTDNAVNETGYRVERATDGVTFTTLATLAADAAAYSDNSVALNNTYTYRVAAFNAIGDAVAPSNVVQVTVAVSAAASNLAATLLSATQVDLAWTDNAVNETGYRVERSTNGAAFSVLATLEPNAAAYSDAAATSGNTYSYRVVAFNQGINGAASNVAAITVGVPSAPTALSAAANSPTSVNLAWTDASNNETSFLLERSTDGVTFVAIFGGASASVNTTGTRISFTDTGVSGAVTYTYRVKAGNTLGSSPPSATVTATTSNVLLAGLTTTTGLTVDANGVAQNSATLTTSNGNITLVIAQGTKIQQRNGQPVTVISAGPLGPSLPGAPPTNALVLAVDFGPDGLKFSPSITMVINYDPATLPAGVRQNKLDVALWDGASWLKLKGIVNTTARTITAQVPHFTAVAILGDQDKPLDVDAWVAGPNEVLLDWNDTIDNETGFRIERSVNDGDFAIIGEADANEDSFVDTDAPAGMPLSYKVIATNAVGDSLESDSADTIIAVPAAPTNLVAVLIGNVQVNLTWADNSSNETGFRVERTPAFDTSVDNILPDRTTSFSDTTLQADTDYEYRVVAFNGAGESATNTVGASTAPPQVIVPQQPQPTPTPTPGPTVAPTPTPAPEATPQATATPSGQQGPGGGPTTPEATPTPMPTPVAEPTVEPVETPEAEPETGSGVSGRLMEREIEAELHSEDEIDRDNAEARDDKGNELGISGDTIRIVTTADGMMAFDLPVALDPGAILMAFNDPMSGAELKGDTLVLRIKDANGREVMRIEAKVDGTDGTGVTARVKVKSATLKTAEQQQDFSAADPQVGMVGGNIQVDLKSLPEGAGVKVTMEKEADAQTQSSFQLAASRSGKQLKDVAFVMNVQKTALENETHLGAATITMQVASAWVEAQGGADNVQIIRVTETGEVEVLETSVLSVDDSGHTFVATSPNGLSAFGLAAIQGAPAQVEPTPTPAPQPTATPAPQPTATPVPQPTATPAPQPTATPAPQPTAVPQPTATGVPQPTPTAVPQANIPAAPQPSEAAPQPATGGAAPASQPAAGGSWWWLAAAIGGIAVMAAAGMLLRRKKT